MTDAPERIGLIGDGCGLWSLWNRDDYGDWGREESTEYIRKDVSDAAIEAARQKERERCAEIAKGHCEIFSFRNRNDLAKGHFAAATAIAAAIREESG